MQYILPRNNTSSLSTPERTFLRSCARGEVSRHSSLLRLDGRFPAEARPIRLSFARCHNRAECSVQLGQETRGAASVWAELVPPLNADRPNDGQVKFRVDAGPLGSDIGGSLYGGGEAADGGQTGENGILSNRILRLLERTLLIGGSIDAEALCVQSGIWVWRLCVDVSLLDDGGNAMDACVLAAMAALRHYRLPEVQLGGSTSDRLGETTSYQETTIVHSDEREPAPLPLHHTPLTATFALFSDELGTKTSVSALLDPSDREESASNGMLTWSYNKYGEMCCLDFPGGCELRHRQLLASSNLGKKRCIEICEMLETALEEAERKAQEDRIERLKNSMIMDEIKLDQIETTQLDKEYLQSILDYASGHVAASVKEDNDRKDTNQKQNKREEDSSLFHAILRSAESNLLNPTEERKKNTSVSTANVDIANDPHDACLRKIDKVHPNEEKIIEIIAHPSKRNQAFIEKETSNTDVSMVHDSDEEEEVIQLQSEFAALNSTVMDPPLESGDPVQKDCIAEKHGLKSSKSSAIKVKSMATDENGDEIDDLVMAMKKKKKSRKKKT